MQRTVSFTYTDPRTDHDFTVWATINPGCTGQRHDGARFAEPDEDAEVHITAIYDEQGSLIPLYTFKDSEIAAMDNEALNEGEPYEVEL